MAKLQHIITDLHQFYLTEMEAQIKPQLGKSFASSSGSDAGKKGAASSGGGDDVTKKQARQLVYDTRYKARREGIPLERAFTQALQNSKASAPIKDAAKAMLFSGGVKEEVDIEEDNNKEKVLVTPAKGYGKPYRRYATRTKIHQLRSNPQIQSVTGTSYGTPYEGERTKGKQTSAALQHKSPDGKDRDGDGKKESSSKEHAGVVHNAIQKATGGVPDGKDTRKKDVKKESFERLSDWRQDLCEVISNSKNDQVKKISEKDTTKVVTNKIVINPDLKEKTNISEISPDLALAASKAADVKRGKLASAGDKEGAAAKAAQASRLYNAQAKKRLNRGNFMPEELVGTTYEIEMEDGETIIIEKVKMDVKDDNGSTRCWKGYRKSGTKVKGGKEVNNCVPEAVDPQSSLSPKQKNTEQQQTLNAKAKLEKILSQQRRLRNNEETELDERRRSEKGTPRAPRNPAFELVAKSMGSSRLGVQPRGEKKVPGGPTPGPAITPKQKVAKRKTEPTKIGSRFD